MALPPELGMQLGGRQVIHCVPELQILLSPNVSISVHPCEAVHSFLRDHGFLNLTLPDRTKNFFYKLI